MESKFNKLKKVVEDLKAYHDDLESCKSKNEYLEYKEGISEALDDASNLPGEIEELSKQLDELEIKRKDLLDKKSQKNTILAKLDPIREEANDLISSVRKKAREFESQQLDSGYSGQNNRGESIGGQMKLLTLERNDEVLQKRRVDLEEIKKTSAEVNKLSEVMKHEVHQQGEMLNDIESNVNKADTNVHRAEEQMKEAENLQRQGRRKTLYLVGIILFVVLVVVAIIILIFVGKSKK